LIWFILTVELSVHGEFLWYRFIWECIHLADGVCAVSNCLRKYRFDFIC
jgi:hypothetical protein